MVRTEYHSVCLFDHGKDKTMDTLSRNCNIFTIQRGMVTDRSRGRIEANSVLSRIHCTAKSAVERLLRMVVKCDITEARAKFVEYRKASKEGDAEAQYNLGVCYYNGEGVRQNRKKASRWWLRSAKQGNPKAQLEVALGYYHGENYPKDYVESVKWCRLAAEQGFAEAQYCLGSHYYYGSGSKKTTIKLQNGFTKGLYKAI